MTSSLPDVSERFDHLSNDVLGAVDRVASERGISFLLIGALARDILLEHLHGISTGRRTLDVDLGVLVDTWDHYLELTTALTDSSAFQKLNPGIQHRFLFQEKVLVDIVPFGALADDQGDIFWPPDDDPKMSIVGFQEALDHSLMVKVASDLVIRVVSLPGLALLKLLAWGERRYLTGNDIHDLAFIMRWYGHVNEDRFFEEHLELYENSGFDPELAGLVLLGQDMAAMMSPGTRTKVIGILGGGDNDDHVNEELVFGIQRNIAGRDYEQAEQYVLNLLNGLSGK